MKAFSDLEQSKKLSEILPIESADMYYAVMEDNIPCKMAYPKDEGYLPGEDIECWSLAALLHVLSYPSLHKTYRGWRCDSYNEEGDVQKIGEDADNPVDACVEMILNLNEQKLL